MDYEQRYKEALEKIRKGLQPLSDGAKISGVTRAFLEEVFPELGESEDEKIRKFLIHVFENNEEVPCGEFNNKKIIAWLEKQGQEPKKVSIWKHWKNGIAGNGDGKPIYLIKNGFTYSLSSCLSFECDYIELSELDNLLLEKQGEKKATDKVKPKFHEGDWIIDKESKEVFYLSKNLANTCKIVDIEGNDYHVPHYTLEEGYDLWTIQDAKDGDVLACGDKITDCPFIFHNLTEKQNPRSYCGINTLGEFQVNDENGGFWCKSDEVRPATKEQRDLLFQKMKEEGYQWDSDKKELNKIEDEIEIPFGAKDSELTEVTYYIPKGFHAEIDDDKVVIKKGEKTAEWSEEDEKMVNDIIASIDTLYYHGMVKWLKSLKQRIEG